MTKIKLNNKRRIATKCPISRTLPSEMSEYLKDIARRAARGDVLNIVVAYEELGKDHRKFCRLVCRSNADVELKFRIPVPAMDPFDG